MFVKLQCACGQKFGFDVEPVNGRTPRAVKCPACGRDATQAANEEIAKPAPAAVPPAPASRKRRWRWAVGICAGLLFLLLVVAGVLYWLFQPELNPRPVPAVNPSPVSAANPPPLAAKPAEIAGIGLRLYRDQDSHQYMVSRTYPNSPAAKAEIPAGLVLHKVDGVLAESQDLGGLSALLRGPVGTKVTLEFIDPKTGKTNVMEITRDTFENRYK